MEHWCLTETRSFKLNRAREGGGAAEQRVDFFIREQAAHFGADIDRFLTRSLTRRFGGHMRFANDNLVHIVEEGHAARRGLGEESLLDVGLKVKRDGHAAPRSRRQRQYY